MANLTIVSRAEWPSAGPNPLSGQSFGVLSSINSTADSIVVMLQADLVSSPNARLLVNFGGPANPQTAQFSIWNGQTVRLRIRSEQVVNWALYDLSNNAVSGGSQDYLRATAYI